MVAGVNAGRRTMAKTYAEIEQKLGLNGTLPVVPDWSATAEFLEIIADHCLRHRPQTIVECSSGLTSIVLARCCQINGSGHVYSLENGEPFVESTRRHIRDFDLQTEQTTIHAPLRETVVADEVFQWYDITRISESVEKIDLLVIDGPPGFIQRQSRYPALPLLSGHLTENTVVFLDDADREDEQVIVQRWLRQFRHYRAVQHPVPRGCCQLEAL